MRPTVKLQEGVFVTDFPGYNLLVAAGERPHQRDEGHHALPDEPDRAPDDDPGPRTAASATRPTAAPPMLDAHDGEIHEVPDRGAGRAVARKYRRLDVQDPRHLHRRRAGGMLERTVGYARSDREMSASEL